MAYTALYRKWRPARFEDVRGQEHIVRTLKNQIISDRVGHAYLFCGTRGTGKTTIAKIMARAVNCEHPVDGSPCNECAVCRSILEGRSVNVAEIDAASNNGVDNIREIRDQVQYSPTEGKYRVYIIDEVHMLSAGAFNALLKTLEEPPAYVIFILATTEVNKIPITVLSRCQRYDFRRIGNNVIADQVSNLLKAEGVEADEDAVRYVAKAADGSMRDALSLLEQCISFYYGQRLTYEKVLDVLGAVDTQVFSKLLRLIIRCDVPGCVQLMDEISSQGRDLSQFVTDFIWYLRNLLLIQATDDAEDILDMSTDNRKLLEEDAKMADGETLMRYIRVFSELSNQIRYASQKRVLVELAFIKLTKPQMEHSYDSIIERLNKIEDQLEEGVPVNPSMLAGMTSPVTQMAVSQAVGPTEPEVPREQVALPKAQYEDLELIRNEWGKIVRTLGGVIRSSFRDTVVEPSGEGCLCVVFASVDNFEIGRRPTIMGELEQYVKNTYGKDIYFKARLMGTGERMDTVYVSDEELRERIHMDIAIEEE